MAGGVAQGHNDLTICLLGVLHDGLYLLMRWQILMLLYDRMISNIRE